MHQSTAEAFIAEVKQICIIANISFGNDLENIVHYHKTCLGKHAHLVSHANIRNATPNNGSGVRQKLYSISVKKVETFVSNTIMRDGEICTLIDVFQLFRESFLEAVKNEECEDHVNCYRADYLLNKLKNRFPELESTIFQKVTYLYNKCISVDNVFRFIKGQLANRDTIKTLAYQIRKDILELKSLDLSVFGKIDKANLNNLNEMPKSLVDFVTFLLVGPKQTTNDIKLMKIPSICHTIINCVTDGRIKSPTNVYLGLTMKSLTNSRTVIDILNRLGFSISYTAAASIESEIAYLGSEQGTCLPHSLIANKPELFTGIAFDNNDRYVETSTGKDTLHDTVGIVYQNVPQGNDFSLAENAMPILVQAVNRTNRRRTYISSFDHQIDDSYVRVRSLMPSYFGSIPQTPTLLNKINDYDNLWMIKCATGCTAQKWNIWNSKYFSDENPRQNIAYLPQINQSPTKDAVVLKTMEIAMQIKNECGQRYIITTYDLAIAMKAYRIQIDHAPAFNEIFILLGPFHVKLSFYKALGKFIDNSGITMLMVSCGLIAEGSLNGFISGKNYNRCKKLHEVNALCLKSLHFKKFLEKNNYIYEESDIRSILENSLNVDQYLYELEDVLKKYKMFFDQTMNGDFGKTAQYICLYVHYVDLINLYERAIRTSDLELFKYCSHEMNAIFFTFNHQNYARWLSRCNDDLQNIDSTHPGLDEFFRNGGLSIRRTNKNFSRSPIDLTLEQTINANSANRSEGITSHTNSINGRQRWAETHSVRMAIRQQMFEFVGLMRTHDLTDSKYQNKVFNQQLSKFKSAVEGSLNPFDDNLNSDQLYNLCTGKAASKDTCEFLLNVKSMGEKQLTAFIQECKINPTRFDRPIKKNKINTFSSELIAGRKKNTNPVCNKQNSFQIDRDVINRVLRMALSNNANLEGLCSYPLTAVPYTLAHPDGTVNLANKNGEILNMFEFNGNEQVAFPKYDVEIVDGNNLLRSLTEVPAKYGRVALYILKKICHTSASEIHILFEKCSINNITNYEDLKKMPYTDTNLPSLFKINGPEQERTLKWSKCINNTDFCNEFIDFCLSYWTDEDIHEILNNKRVFVDYGNNCFLFANQYEKRKPIISLRNNHICLNSKIILHVSKTCGGCRVLIKTPNLDAVLFYLMYHMQYFTDGKQIWILTGRDLKNKLINASDIYNQIDQNVLNALPAWYVFTGCPFEPAFHGKGRKATYKLLLKDTSYQEAFSQLGMQTTLSNDVYKTIEKYTCRLYVKDLEDVNQARAKMFRDADDNMHGMSLCYCLFYLDMNKQRKQFKLKNEL